MKKITPLIAIPTYTLMIFMVSVIVVIVMSGCQSEAEKQKEAQKDAKQEWLKKFGFDDKVPDELLGRWISVEDPRLSFVIEAKGDSVIKKHYYSGPGRGHEECDGCGSITGLYFDADHDAFYQPELFPNRRFRFIENDTSRWRGEIYRFRVEGDTLTFFGLDKSFNRHPNAKDYKYILIGN